MMADRGWTYAVAALGASVLLAGGTAAEEMWPRYAPRCVPTDLMQSGMTDPCEQRVAIFGIGGPQVLGSSQAFDVEATGSIEGDSRRDRDNARAPM